MAVSKVVEDKFEDILTDILTCTICLDKFDELERKPKQLQCRHTFCMACMKQLASQNLYGVVPCPMCKKAVNSEDIHELPNNLTVIALLDKVKTRPASRHEPTSWVGHQVNTCYVDQASSMASSISKNTYPVPTIPNTPSHTINHMLHIRCGKSHDNPVRAGIAHYICIVFTAINNMYGLIHGESTPSHTMWILSCGAVSAAIIFTMMIICKILLASAFLVDVLIKFSLYYSAIGVVLFGAGLGVGGMLFFDKEGGIQAPVLRQQQE